MIFVLKAFDDYLDTTFEFNPIFNSSHTNDIFQSIIEQYLQKMSESSNRVVSEILNSLNGFFMYLNDKTILQICWCSFHRDSPRVDLSCLKFLVNHVRILSQTTSEYKEQGLLCLNIIRKYCLLHTIKGNSMWEKAMYDWGVHILK